MRSVEINCMKSNNIQVLIIEDNAIDQNVFRQYITTHKLPYTCCYVGNLEEAQHILGVRKFDIILNCCDLDDCTAYKALIAETEAPVIVLIEEARKEKAVEALKSGAYEFLLKDADRNYLKVLPLAIENTLKRDRAEVTKRMLTQAMKSISDSLYITSAENTIIFVNDAFCETYGYREEEILGEQDALLMKKEAGGRPLDYPGEITRHYRKDGSEFPVKLTQSILSSDKGRKIATFTVVCDITKEKKAGKEQIHVRKLESVIALAGKACHELNQPLQAISGYSELLMMEIDESNPFYRLVREIKNESDRLGTITRKINTITRRATDDDTIDCLALELPAGYIHEKWSE